MNAKGSVGKEPHYIWMMLIVLVTWGIVPGLAQLGKLDGLTTTFYVNWFAVVALAIIITVKKLWKEFKEYSKKDYAKMIGLGFLWPFVYSIAYFQSIKLTGAAFTTVLNYTWPIFFILISVALLKKQSVYTDKRGKFFIVPILLSFAAVVTYKVGGPGGNENYSVLVAFGLLAAFSQALFFYLSGNLKYNDWVMTFVIEVVTVVLVTPVLLLVNPIADPGVKAIGYIGTIIIPEVKVLWYLVMIGAVSNGIGFWAFIKGASLIKENNKEREPLWLIGMSSVPLTQIIFLPMMGIPLGTSVVVSIILAGLSLAVYSILKYRIEKNNKV